MTWTVQTAIDELKQRKKSITSSELIKILTDLGFNIKKTHKAGHYQVTHLKLKNFYGTSFDSGHGVTRRNYIKAPYILKILRLLEKHEKELLDR